VVNTWASVLHRTPYWDKTSSFKWRRQRRIRNYNKFGLWWCFIKTPTREFELKNPPESVKEKMAELWGGGGNFTKAENSSAVGKNLRGGGEKSPLMSKKGLAKRRTANFEIPTVERPPKGERVRAEKEQGKNGWKCRGAEKTLSRSFEFPGTFAGGGEKGGQNLNHRKNGEWGKNEVTEETNNSKIGGEKTCTEFGKKPPLKKILKSSKRDLKSGEQRPTQVPFMWGETSNDRASVRLDGKGVVAGSGKARCNSGGGAHREILRWSVGTPKPTKGVR